MKNTIAIISIAFAMSMLACDTGEHSTKELASDNMKAVGDRIQNSVAERWISNFRKSQNPQGRDGDYVYRISASELTSMLQSVPDFIGVTFHYGIDNAGTKHIITAPIITFDVWKPIPGRIMVDANANIKMDEHEAESWAKNYTSTHTGQVWFHFFGSNIFDEIVAHPMFNGVDIEPAIDDAGVSQLILVVGRSTDATGGRSKSDPAYYDISSQCPPCPR